MTFPKKDALSDWFLRSDTSQKYSKNKKVVITTEKDGKIIKNGIESTQIEESHIQSDTCNERKPELRVFVILLKTRSIF